VVLVDSRGAVIDEQQEKLFDRYRWVARVLVVVVVPQGVVAAAREAGVAVEGVVLRAEGARVQVEGVEVVGVPRREVLVEEKQEARELH
jgi:L-ascorbate metabolism protein UlaG (beta-lactamase superfamily)